MCCRCWDYAILVISGTDGVQSHTQTLWRLLEAYEVPTWIFVNKMDRPETDRAALLSEIRKTLGGVSAVGSAVFADFGRLTEFETREEIGSASEALLETFLADAPFADSAICDAIAARQLFPVCFGSALQGRWRAGAPDAAWAVYERMRGASSWGCAAE